jgi:hypothetical protein
MNVVRRERASDVLMTFTIREGLEIDHLSGGRVRVWIHMRHGLSFGWVPVDLGRDELFALINAVTWVVKPAAEVSP